MKKNLKKRVLYPFIGLATFIFAFVMLFVNSPNVYADTSYTYSVSNINFKTASADGYFTVNEKNDESTSKEGKITELTWVMSAGSSLLFTFTPTNKIITSVSTFNFYGEYYIGDSDEKEAKSVTYSVFFGGYTSESENITSEYTFSIDQDQLNARKPGSINFIITANETLRLRADGEFVFNTKDANVDVNFDAQGGTGGTSTIKATPGSAMPSITLPTKTGYTFDGYYTGTNGGGTKYYNANGSSANNCPSTGLTLYAKWTAINYLISYNLNGGSASNSTSYNIETASFTLTNPTKNGYTFKGWSGTGLSGDSNKNVSVAKGSTGNRSYTANWTANEYTITYNANGGSVSPTSVKYKTNNNSLTATAQSITLATPTKTGYTFTGWTTNKSGVSISNKTTLTINQNTYGDFTVTANWTAINYSITYNLNGGSASNPTSYNIETTSFTLTNPTKTGYTFDGWSGTDILDKSTSVTISNGSIGDRTYTANWIANTYTITFDKQGGTGDGNSVSATYDSEMPEIIIPTYENHTFTGYYDSVSGGTKYYNADGSSAKTWDKASDESLYAQWTIDIDVLVSLNGNSGGYTCTWDNQPHWLVITPKDAVTNDVLNDATIYYGTSSTSVNNLDLDDFKYSDAGTYTVFYRIEKEGYTTTSGSQEFIINKAPSVVDPTPVAKTGLEYIALDQELIVAGDVDFGNMLYAVSTDNTVIPADSEFYPEIPTGKYVNTYYVFYKSSGDSNHNPYEASLSNAIIIKIARVDRTEAENINNTVATYLDTLDERFVEIKNNLSSIRTTFEAEAITEDNITIESVATKVSEMKASLSEAKVNVTEALIEFIGTVVYPDSNGAILAALNYYSTILSEIEKAMVDSNLKKAMDDAKALYDVVDEMAGMIRNIPSPSESQNYYDKVDLSKEFYDDLEEEQSKTLIAATDSNYYKTLLDNVAAREVIEFIQNIGEVTYNGGENDSLAAIEFAEEGYNLLSSDQKQLVKVVNYNNLTHDRQVYDNVNHVVELISMIGEVKHSKASKEKIDISRNSYDALDTQEKILVNGYNKSYKVLEDDEHVYETMVLIDNIGYVNYDTDPEERISKAREYYDSLTEDQKAQVGDAYLNVLVTSENDSDHITKVNTTWLIIGLVLSGLIIVAAGLFIFFLFFKRKKDDEDDDKNQKNGQKKPVKVMSFGGISSIILSSHYHDAAWIILYVIAPIAFLAIVACVILFIMKKRQVGCFKNKNDKEEENVEAEEVKKEPISEEEKEQKRISKRQQKLLELSALGIEYSKNVEVTEDENGIEAIGIIYDAKSKVYMFGPKEYKLNIGDIVKVKDSTDNIRTVVVVVPNKKVAESEIVKPFKDIEEVVYQVTKTNVENIEKARLEAEEQARKEAEEKALLEAEEKAREEAEEKAREEAETKAQEEALEQANQEAEDETDEDETADEEDDESDEDSEETSDNEEALVSKDDVVEFDEATKKYKVTKIKKTYEAKMCSLSDEVKELYSDVKNALLSYGLQLTSTKTAEKFRIKRNYYAQLKICGKQIGLYLSLDPKEYAESKYKGKDLSDKKAYAATPFLYKFKTARKAKWALELVDALALKESLTKLDNYEPKDFKNDYPNLTEEELIEKGYIVKTVTITDKAPKGFHKIEEIKE